MTLIIYPTRIDLGAVTERYADTPGFCKSVKLEEIHNHGHILTPGRYVGAEPQSDDGEAFKHKMSGLVAQWGEQQVG